MRKHMFRRAVTIALMTLVAIPTAIVGIAPAAQAGVPPLTWPATPLTGWPNAHLALSQVDGGVTVGCGVGPTLFRSFNATGAAVQTVTATPEDDAESCEGRTVVGSTGIVYLVAGLNSTQNVVKAYKSGELLWTYTPSCGREVLTLRIGTNGNIYMLTSGGSPIVVGCSSRQLIGVKPTLAAGQTKPAVVLNVTPAGTPDRGDFTTYSGGLVVRTAQGVQYITYGGVISPVKAFTVGQTNGQPVEATLSGRVFLPAKPVTNSGLCLSGSEWVSSLAAYEPAGRKWVYTLPPCSQVREVRPTPSGGVVFRLTTQVSGEWVEKLVVLNSAGKQIWVYDKPADPTLLHHTRLFDVDLNGNVAVQDDVMVRYDSNGWGTYKVPAVRIKLLSGLNGLVVSSAELSGEPNTTSGYMWGNGSINIGKGTVYVIAEPCPNGWPCGGGVFHFISLSRSG